MARRTHEDALGVAGAETVIGTGVVVTGDLKTESDIIIDGRLTGDIVAQGDVTIGVNAVITANVKGQNVTVAGHLTGNVSATGEAKILQTGNVKGNISASGLAISSGAIFIGQSIMESAPSLSPSPDADDDPSASIPK